MKPKEKKCKGTGKAKGFGCGEPSFYRTYGLCQNCYPQWLYTSDKGKEVLKKFTIKAKKEVKKQKANEWKKEKKILKEKVKTHSDYQKELQIQINKLARAIDFGNDCMMCKSKLKGLSFGCHYHSVGSNNSLRFNLFNIWIGCRNCNEFKGGNIIGYDEVLIDTYGEYKWNWIKFGMKLHYPEIRMTKEEIKEKVKLAKNICKEVPLEVRSPEERWNLRNEINQRLGIYL